MIHNLLNWLHVVKQEMGMWMYAIYLLQGELQMVAVLLVDKLTA